MNKTKVKPTATLILEVQLRSVYGRDLIYPVNETALKFCEFVERKTLTERDVKVLTELGAEFIWIPASLDERTGQ